MDFITRRLRNYALSAALLFTGAFAHAAELSPVTIRDFTCGLQTTADPAVIGDNCAQDLKNVDVWTGRIQKRRGSVLQNSATIGGFTAEEIRKLHEFVDSTGNFWQIIVTSNSIYGSKDAGVSSQLLTAGLGVTQSSKFQAVNAFNKVRLTDGTTNWILFDGATVSVSTASPKGRVAAFYFQRIWTAGVSGTRSTLYGSRFGDPEDWTDGGLSDDDATQLLIRENDGYEITALKTFRNGLIVFKPYSMDLLTMTADGLTPQLTPISNTIGTSYPTTIQETPNELIFLGPDGYYKYTGVSLELISAPIEPQVDAIAQRNATSRSYTETTQAQFSVGTSSGVSPFVSPHDIVLSTWTGTDTSSADFGAGTLTNVSTNVLSGTVYLSTNNTNLLNNSFETGTGSNADNWTEVNGGRSSLDLCSSSVLPVSGTFHYVLISADKSIHFGAWQILDVNDSLLATSSPTVGVTYSQFSIPSSTLSTFTGRVIKLRFTRSDGATFMTSDAFIASGSTITFYAASCDSVSSWSNAIDLIEGGRSTVATGTFRSQTFDTALSTPAWLASSVSTTSNGHSLTWQTETSTSGVTWDSPVSWTPGTAPTSNRRRYIRYTLTFTTATTGTGLPFLSDVTLAARNSLGRYLSPAISIGSAISSWGQFSGTSESDGATQRFELYTDTNTASGINVDVASTFVSSQVITHGSIPTITTGTVAYVASYHQLVYSTQNPSMSDYTLTWNEGDSNFPPASVYFDGDYFCAVAIDSQTVNDTILIFDRNGAWTQYKGLYPYSMGLYRQQPYIGDARQGSIYRFQADDVFADNNVAIDAYWLSKEFDFGFPIEDKTMMRYYITAERIVNSDAVFSYGVNRGSLTTATLDLDSVAGFFRKSIVPTSLTYQKGVNHRFKFSDSEANDNFSILSITLVPRLETAP